MILIVMLHILSSRHISKSGKKKKHKTVQIPKLMNGYIISR